MPGYDLPITEEYTIDNAASATFGATTTSRRIIGPKGRKGYVRDIQVDVVTTLVGTTTVPEVMVGTAQGDSTYARFRLGTSATAGYTAALYRAAQVGGNTLYDGSPSYEDFTGHVKMMTAPIPADTGAVISLVAGVGGTPAGGGAVRVTIDWI